MSLNPFERTIKNEKLLYLRKNSFNKSLADQILE